MTSGGRQQAIAARAPHGISSFLLPRPSRLEDEDAVGVRRVRGGVRRPQGDEVVRPLPGVACAGYAHC